MTLFILAGLALIVLTFMNDIEHQPTMRERVTQALQLGIVEPLRLPSIALRVLLAHSAVETGNWSSNAFLKTWSLFNRHKGSGRGEWTGQTYYANSSDPDLRIFADVYQSARDFRQLLTDPLYNQAYLALRNGEAGKYFQALERAGFAASKNYARTLQAKYDALA